MKFPLRHALEKEYSRFFILLQVKKKAFIISVHFQNTSIGTRKK